MLKAAVTTGSKNISAVREQAVAWAKELALPWLERRGPLEAMCAQAALDALLVVTKQGPRVYLPHDGGLFFFHPSLSVLRVQRLARGGHDLMLNAMALSPGEQVLDCTLGLASDACVMAHALGESGRVCGLEASPLIALVVREGLKVCQTQDEQPDWLRTAAARVEVQTGRYEAVLAALPDRSYDVVYFDPLFVHPVAGSASMSPLRPLAQAGGVDDASLAQARRVARRRVVIKDHRSGALLKALRAPELSGGKYSHIRFGIWEANK